MSAQGSSILKSNPCCMTAWPENFFKPKKTLRFWIRGGWGLRLFEVSRFRARMKVRSRSGLDGSAQRYTLRSQGFDGVSVSRHIGPQTYRPPNPLKSYGLPVSAEGSESVRLRCGCPLARDLPTENKKKNKKGSCQKAITAEPGTVHCPSELAKVLRQQVPRNYRQHGFQVWKICVVRCKF